MARKTKTVKAITSWALVDSLGAMMGTEHQPRLFASAGHANDYKRITCCEEDQVIYQPIPVEIRPLKKPRKPKP